MPRPKPFQEIYKPGSGPLTKSKSRSRRSRSKNDRSDKISTDNISDNNTQNNNRHFTKKSILKRNNTDLERITKNKTDKSSTENVDFITKRLDLKTDDSSLLSFNSDSSISNLSPMRSRLFTNRTFHNKLDPSKIETHSNLTSSDSSLSLPEIKNSIKAQPKSLEINDNTSSDSSKSKLNVNTKSRPFSTSISVINNSKYRNTDSDREQIAKTSDFKSNPVPDLELNCLITHFGQTYVSEHKRDNQKSNSSDNQDYLPDNPRNYPLPSYQESNPTDNQEDNHDYLTVCNPRNYPLSNASDNLPPDPNDIEKGNPPDNHEDNLRNYHIPSYVSTEDYAVDNLQLSDPKSNPIDNQGDNQVFNVRNYPIPSYVRREDYAVDNLQPSDPKSNPTDNQGDNQVYNVRNYPIPSYVSSENYPSDNLKLSDSNGNKSEDYQLNDNASCVENETVDNLPGSNPSDYQTDYPEENNDNLSYIASSNAPFTDNNTVDDLPIGNQANQNFSNYPNYLLLNNPGYHSSDIQNEANNLMNMNVNYQPVGNLNYQVGNQLPNVNQTPLCCGPLCQAGYQTAHYSNYGYPTPPGYYHNVQNQNYGYQNQNYGYQNQNYGYQNQNYGYQNQSYGYQCQNYRYQSQNYQQMQNVSTISPSVGNIYFDPSRPPPNYPYQNPPNSSNSSFYQQTQVRFFPIPSYVQNTRPNKNVRGQKRK